MLKLALVSLIISDSFVISMKPLFPAAALAIAAISFGLSIAVAQPAAPPAKGPAFVWPTEMKNRKVLPADFGGDRLRGVMVGFSQSLGVRCTHCHVGVEGQPLTTFDFASDAKRHKETARAMMQLVYKLNTQELDAIPGLVDAKVTCYTCHRGSTKPLTAAPAAPAAPAAAEPSAAPKPASSERG